MTAYRRIRQRVRRGKKARRGVALILVLGALVILIVFATELQERTASTVAASSSDRDSVRAEYHARSSINLMRLLIATEPAVRKAVDPMFRVAMKSPAPQIPVWKMADLVLAPFNDKDHALDFESLTGVAVESGTNLGLTGGYFETPIVVEEDALINVNASSSGDAFTAKSVSSKLLGLFGTPAFADFFTEADADGQYSDPSTICSALIDWSDQDELTAPCDPVGTTAKATESGEDNYYQTIGLKYFRKNAPYDSVEELRLVRGVNDDFWGNFVDPDPADPTKRTLTVWGQGKVNVNAANAQTLLAVVCSGAPEAPMCNDVEQMTIFLTALQLGREITQGAPLFKTPKGFIRAMSGKGKGIGPLFAALGLEPVEFTNAKQVQKSISTESRVFSIYAEGVVVGRNRETRTRIHTVVDFRSANELGAETKDDSSSTSETDTSTKGKTGSEGEESTSTSTEPTADQLAAAMASDPMGVIIYHRLE